MMSKIGFGFVGTGMIAGRMAVALETAEAVRLVAVASRSLATAEKFVAGREGVIAVEGLEALLEVPGVDAVYVATPTAAKEEIALRAIAAGKHVLVDKPFWDAASARRMAEAAEARGLVFMDATHFVHHPRTASVAGDEKMGAPRALASSFYTPELGSGNIRFDTALEPTGVIGDLAWYCMRAVVEYLRPVGEIVRVATIAERGEGGAVVRASGVIGFASGETSTWEAGMGVGTWLQGLQLLGSRGVIEMDDFVQDFYKSAGLGGAENKTGYWRRGGMDSRKDVVFVETAFDRSAQTAMFERFAEIVLAGDVVARRGFAEAAVKTQMLVDAIWAGTARS